MKYQTIAMAMAMLIISLPASAQINESIFTDTNGIEVHAPSPRLLLNPASSVTFTLIAGLDRYVNAKITSKAVGYESVSQLSARFPYLQEKRTVTDLTGGGGSVLQIVHFTSSLSDVYELTIKLRNMSPGE